MMVASSAVFVYLYMHKGSYTHINNGDRNIENKNPVAKSDSIKNVSQIDDLDIDNSSESELGPDVEDDIAKEETAFTQQSDLEKSRALNGFDKSGIPSCKIRIVPDDIGLPKFIVSGIICDIEKRYVFINGMPYSQNDKFMGIEIANIGISDFKITYKNKYYDIFLY